MKIYSLDTPTSTEELAKWIEQHLVSESFAEFVGQLGVAAETNREGREPMKLDAIFTAAELTSVLKSGLTACRREQLEMLIGNPAELMELQFQVYAQGHPYWMRDVALNDGEQRPVTLANDAIRRPRKHSAAHRHWLSGWRGVAVAASVLVMVGAAWQWIAQNNSGVVAQQWRWLDQERLERQSSPAALLNVVASQAREWPEARSSEPKTFEKQLRNMIADCDLLIDNRHPSLSDAQHTWLAGKCAAWKEKFERLAVELEEDPTQFMQILKSMDQLVAKMSQVLEDEATLWNAA